jgi:hypothetical protein
MNKPINKKTCSSCDVFYGLGYFDRGIKFGVCGGDCRIEASDSKCKNWKGKKYNRRKKHETDDR